MPEPSLPEDAPGTYVPTDKQPYYKPEPLPPEPSLELTAETETLICDVDDALSTAATARTADATTAESEWLWAEARASSAIEGIPEPYSTVTIDPETGRADIPAVNNYLSALETGLASVTSPTDITSDLLDTLHTELLTDVYTGPGELGEFRSQYVYIGHQDPFVPVAPTGIPPQMDTLESYIQSSDTPYHWLVDLALSHYQFETIHPYIDGNGRLGRIVLALELATHLDNDSFVFAPSTELLERRDRYFELLQMVSETGAWTEWIEFVLEGLLTHAERDTPPNSR